MFNRDLVIVQPARMTPRKKLELSLHIAPGVKDLGYNLLYILTGAYDLHSPDAFSYCAKLKTMISNLGLQQNAAILAEYTSHDHSILVTDPTFIRDLYLLADLLLMTSNDEGFGLSTIETGLYKLPIACTDIPAFMELGIDLCVFNIDDSLTSISGRVMEYLARTNTHRMFRHIMQYHILNTICEEEVLPCFAPITKKRNVDQAQGCR